MKLRLSIAVAPGNAISFEHAGPVIRIGRDSECELCLQGDASTGVSRQHARIDLAAERATLVDIGSSNGTLLNGQLLEAAAPLRVGDRIQMGYTGPTLTVLELDLHTPPARDAARLLRTVLAGALVAGTLAAVVLAAVIHLSNAKTPDEPVRDVLAEKPAVTQPTEAKKSQAAASLPAVTGQQLLPLADTKSLEETAKAGPSEELKEVGAYVALEHWVSVLLQRQGEGYPWAVLRPEARVSTGYTLVSLPGYRSLITLDSGLHLTLWGNLPEFSNWPPAFESVVMLNAASSGVSLDFTLDRGRVVVSNRKPAGGPALVCVRFLSEVWQLELPDTMSEVGLELWARPRAAPSELGPRSPAACVGLFTKGRVRVVTPRQTIELGERSRLAWVSQDPTRYFRENLPELPGWWVKPPDRKAPEVQKALRSLIDWSDQLGGSNTDPTKGNAQANRGEPVLTRIKTQVEEVKDPDNQDVGVFFLAALDELEPLVDLLKYGQSPNIRGVTLFVLQSWLSRGSQHADDLTRILEKRGDSKDRAERIVGLLHFLPEVAVKQRQTYDQLVKDLDDDNRVVRDLAFWHLNQLGARGLLPEEVKKIDYDYDPTWEREKRRPAVAQWKKLIAEGKVPMLSRTP